MLPRRGLVFTSISSARRSYPSVGWVSTLRCDSGNTFLTEELLAGQETPGKIDEIFIFFFPRFEMLSHDFHQQGLGCVA